MMIGFILLAYFICSVVSPDAWTDRIYPIPNMIMYAKGGVMTLADNVILVRSLEKSNETGRYSFMIMDTGYYTQFPFIDAFFKNNSLGVTYDDVTHILLSHAHVDHASNANQLKKLTNAKMILTDYENEFLNSGINSDYYARGFMDKLTLYQWVHYAAGEDYDAVETNPDDDVIINLEKLMNENFPLKEFGAEVVWSPGHTRGSIAVYFEDVKFLFTGDAVTQASLNSVMILGWIESFNDINYTINGVFNFLNFDHFICVHCFTPFNRTVFNASFKGKSWSD